MSSTSIGQSQSPAAQGEHGTESDHKTLDDRSRKEETAKSPAGNPAAAQAGQARAGARSDANEDGAANRPRSTPRR